MLVVLLSLATLTLPAPSLAQDVHVTVDWAFDALRIGTLEFNGGAIAGDVSTDVSSQLLAVFQVPVPNVRSVEWVGEEIWVGTTSGVLRFSDAPFTLLGYGLLFEFVRAIVPEPSGGALVFAGGDAVTLDAAGVEVSRVPFGPVDDVIRYAGGFAVVKAHQGPKIVVRYDAQLQPLGELGANLYQLASSQGMSYSPSRLTALSNGRLAVSATYSVGIIDAAGLGVTVLNTGIGEVACLGSSDGDLFIPASWGSVIYDLRTGGDVGLHPFFSGRDTTYSHASRDLGGPSIVERLCVTSPNTVGLGARVHMLGSADTDLEQLAVGMTGAPPLSFGLLAYSPNPYAAPFGDGTLCLSPFAPGITRTPLFVTRLEGDVTLLMNFQSPGLGSAFLPGTTWYFQGIYRDSAGSGFNTSDSVALTFGG